jgi:hypothetical protein
MISFTGWVVTVKGMGGCKRWVVRRDGGFNGRVVRRYRWFQGMGS